MKTTTSVIGNQSLIKNIFIQIFLTACLLFAVTGFSPLIGWEHLKPHIDLKRFILISALAVGSFAACFVFAKDRNRFFLLEPMHSIKKFFELSPLLSVGMIYFLYFATQLSSQIAMHAAQETALFDFGFFDQVLWSSAHGHSLVTSVRGGLHVFVEHFKPILAVVAWIYKFTNNESILFAVTTGVISTSLIAVYLIAKTTSKSHAFGLLFTLCVFFYQPFRNGINFLFHTQTLADPFLLFGFYFGLKRYKLASVVSIIAALSCKENIVFMVFGMGLFFISRKEKIGYAFIAATAAYLAVFLIFIEPNHHYEHHFRDKWTYFNHFFTWSPEGWMKVLEPNPLVFLYRVFGPFLFLSFFCRGWYWLLGPTLAFHLLSNYAGFRLITAHYTAGLNSLVFISAVEGFCRLTGAFGGERPNMKFRWLRTFGQRPGLGCLLIFCAVAFAGIPQMFYIDKNLNEASKPEHQRIIQVLESIPPHYSVLASERLTAHLAHRPYLFAFFQVFKNTPLESMANQPDLIVVDEERKEDRIVKAIQGFSAQGYQKIWKTGFITIYERPQAYPAIAQENTRIWHDIESMPIVPYRKLYRQSYRWFMMVAGTLFFFWIVRRARIAA